jgi:hypothetical protein
MRKQLQFNIPFSGFNALTFSNCFSSIYMYLEKIKGVDEYDCPKNEEKSCNGCGNCNSTSNKKQENYYFLFDTLSGRSSMRPDFSGSGINIDSMHESIDLLIKFVGYNYVISKDNIAENIKTSINADKPVLARVKANNEKEGVFRVITGYDDDLLIMADPSNAQEKPVAPPSYEDILEIIVFTEKTKPSYTLIDCLKQIKSVMDKNLEDKIWDKYIQKFMYWDEKLQDEEFEEIKRRFKRISDIAWHNFNCHNFAEVFRHRIIDELMDSRLDEVCRQIDESYDNSHTRNWQIIGLNDCRDWSNRRYNELEWGYCTCVVQCLEKLKNYDYEVRAAIEKAIEILN